MSDDAKPTSMPEEQALPTKEPEHDPANDVVESATTSTVKPKAPRGRPRKVRADNKNTKMSKNARKKLRSKAEAEAQANAQTETSSSTRGYLEQTTREATEENINEGSVQEAREETNAQAVASRSETSVWTEDDGANDRKASLLGTETVDDPLDRSRSNSMANQKLPESRARPGKKEQTKIRRLERDSREQWQKQKAALKEKFPSGWMPQKRLSPDAIAGIRALNAQFPDMYDAAHLARRFEVSPEAMRRILRSRWEPSPEVEEGRQERWHRRGMQVWSRKAAMGIKPPKKWRDEGITRDPVFHQRKAEAREKDKQWEEEERRKYQEYRATLNKGVGNVFGA